jgi:eukaryotic-like serine/threonine-protein kinase
MVEQKILGKYELQERLGRGTFAEVYRAINTAVGRTVALKVMRSDKVSPETIDRFRQEAQAAAGLDHPQIVNVIDMDEADGSYFLVMRYVKSTSLKDVLKQRGALPWEDALQIARQTADALDYAHANGLLHRDVKPSNILISSSEGAVLTDFGLGKEIDSGGDDTYTGTHTGMILGTPQYIAPEIWDGQEATPASDQYALACVVCEILTGQVLFDAPMPFAAAKKHGLPPQFPEIWLAGIPDGIDAVLSKALAMDSKDRYTSCAAFAAALSELQTISEEAARKAKNHHAMQALVEMAQELEQGGNYEGALDTCRRALGKCAEGSDQALEIQAVIERLELETWQAEEERERQQEIKRQQQVAVAEKMKRKEQRETVKPWWQQWYAWAGTAAVIVLILALSGVFSPPPAIPAAEEAAAPVSAEEPAKTTVPAYTTAPTATPTPELGIGSTQVSQKDGMVMMYVPAGNFEMGSNTFDSDEKPVHTVYLDAFWIDRTEVTNEMFAAFLNDQGNQDEGGAAWLNAGDGEKRINQSGGLWQAESGYRGHPVVEVTWYGAAAYCEWTGKRMPTEAEWEKAARGTISRTYPWGDKIDCTKANYSGKEGGCVGDTNIVGSYPGGASPYGALDMAGNVWEWVADWYDSNYYGRSSDSNPTGPSSGDARVLRGGSWSSSGSSARSADRYGLDPNVAYGGIGFRCATSAASP